jgi:GrpB-like predicted nucleotidyltransferase (UPF0157 family)
VFEAERARPLVVASRWMVAIEPIGGTAVAALSARLVIDILVSVHELAGADVHCIKPICELGYEYIAEYEKLMAFRR